MAAARHQVAGLGRLRRQQARRHVVRGHVDSAHACRRPQKITEYVREELGPRKLGRLVRTRPPRCSSTPRAASARRSARATPASPAARSSSTATAAWAGTAAARSPARTREGRPQRRLHGPLGGEARRGQGLAEGCEVQFAYAIGIAQPVSVNIDTFGTATGGCRRVRESGCSASAGRHHRPVRPAPADLPPDDQLRPLRQEGHDLGSHRQVSRTAPAPTTAPGGASAGAAVLWPGARRRAPWRRCTRRRARHEAARMAAVTMPTRSTPAPLAASITATTSP